MQASPWFSNESPGSQPETDVYHNNLCCTRGRKVEKNHHRYGTDNRPLCPNCIRLNAAGR
jgi:hypothetical protein